MKWIDWKGPGTFQATGVNVDGWKVMQWPEFKALMDRLGVPADRPTTAITLRVAIGETPMVNHEYRGRDQQPGAKGLKVVETTDVNNKEYQTFAPSERSN